MLYESSSSSTISSNNQTTNIIMQSSTTQPLAVSSEPAIINDIYETKQNKNYTYLDNFIQVNCFLPFYLIEIIHASVLIFFGVCVFIFLAYFCRCLKLNIFLNRYCVLYLGFCCRMRSMMMTTPLTILEDSIRYI